MTWKILATIMITLVILAVLLSSNPQVSNFFNSIFGRFSGVVETEEARNVQFELYLESYGKIEHESSRPVNISMNAERFETKIGEASINVTEKNVSITNYKGKIEINGKNITLDGKFESLLLPGFASFPGGAASVSAGFGSLQIGNIGPKQFAMNTSGLLRIGASESRFNGTINIASPLGTFSFGDNLTITGKARKISIPESGINIG